MVGLLRFKSEEEAKKRAKEDLRAIIRQSGARLNCKSLQTMRTEFEQKKDDVDRELVFNIEKKVQQISQGVQMLSQREEVTKDIRLKIENIREIWNGSCGKFSDISEPVDNLLKSKRHIEQVLGMLQNFLDMELQVEVLTAQLNDEDQIFDVYKKIKIMNYMRTSFLQKIESNTSSGSAQSKLQKIREHFRAVRELEKQFHEHVVQGSLQECHMLAKKNPSLLVKVLRVIENEEVTNASLQQKFSLQEEEEKKRVNIEQLGRDSELITTQKKGITQQKSDLSESKQTLKEKSLAVLRICIKRRAGEFFQAEGSTEGVRGQFFALLQKAEELVTDLKYVRMSVEPCFPPQYQIFEMHFQIYKRELQERIDSVLAGPQMDQLLSEDPEAILFFSGFVQNCQAIINELQFQDDFFMNLQIRLEEFYPRFMDHAGSQFLERLQRINDEQKVQEADKVDKFLKGKKKKLTYETTFAADIFDFMSAQLEAIQESLKGEKLFEFVKIMMEQLVCLVQHVVQTSLEFEPRNPRSLVGLAIRLNDLTKVASEYSKFKEQAIKTIGPQFAERVDNVLDDFFRQLIEQANIQAEVVALYIIRSEIEQELMLHFFTVTWRENHEVMLTEVLKQAGGYMQDVFKIVQEERFAGKIAEALYSMIVDSYVERFIIAVFQRYKLTKVEFVKPLLKSVLEDALRSKSDKDKLIQKKDLIDFYAKGIDQELFEVIQKDLKHFQEFREAYKEEIMQNRFTRKINLLSLISLMINASKEDEFMDYEKQLWTLLSQSDGDPKVIAVGPGGIIIDGNILVRVCRKLKTKNGRQTGFFKNTKKLEKKLGKTKVMKSGKSDKKK